VNNFPNFVRRDVIEGQSNAKSPSAMTQAVSSQSLIVEGRVEFQACFWIFAPLTLTLLFLVVGLVWSNEAESYAGGSLATGMVSYDGHFEGGNPNRKGPALPG
jgi:hypothetical protein